MLFFLSFVLFIAFMVACLIFNISTVAALAAGYVCFAFAAIKGGCGLKETIASSIEGAKKALSVVLVLLIIGMLTASWRACGTIMFFVDYGMKLISPQFFVLFTFLLNALLSYAIGTSFGVAGTMGVVCMALARAGGVNELVAAGAVMSGIYVGDRGSPASSALNLVSAVTDTKLYDNVRSFAIEAVVPMIISAAAYIVLSLLNPLKAVDTELLRTIENEIAMSPWLVVPALCMLVLPLFKVKVKLAMLLSIASAVLAAVFVQKMALADTLWYLAAGYTAKGSALGNMVNGGGIVSMLEISVILLISGSYSGIFEKAGVVEKLSITVERLMEKYGRFAVTAVCGAVFSALFCNQTIAIIMLALLMKKTYESCGGGSVLAVDIGSSAMVLCGVIPWCIACSVPLKYLGAGAGAIAYSVLLYALPICRLASCAMKRKIIYDKS